MEKEVVENNEDEKKKEEEKEFEKRSIEKIGGKE